MTLSLLMANAWSWALQILLLVAVTGAARALLGVSDARLRLRTWHGVWLVSLLLPWVERWQSAVMRSPGIASAPSESSRFLWEPARRRLRSG
jgi:hypothetical protein